MDLSKARTTGEMRAVTEQIMLTTSPGHVLLLLVTLPFLALGWVIGRLWYLGVMCFVASAEGYWTGAKVPEDRRGWNPQPQDPRQQ